MIVERSRVIQYGKAQLEILRWLVENQRPNTECFVHYRSGGTYQLLGPIAAYLSHNSLSNHPFFLDPMYTTQMRVEFSEIEDALLFRLRWS